MCPYVHFLMRCYVNRFNAVCEVNCLCDFMGQGTLCFADVKLNANMLLHGSILPYVCLRVPSLKIKIVPLTFNVIQLTIAICPAFPQKFFLTFQNS